jgi:predicted RNA polymerase sigma factor
VQPREYRPVSAAETAEEVARTSYGRLVAYLARSTRDLAAAEDALGDALVAALETWPRRGVPDNPDAWLLTAARRNVIGSIRRAGTAERNLPDLLVVHDEQNEPPQEATVIPDRRLELLYVCAHPAIDRSVRSPLMLQTVFGLDAVRIASAFVVAPKTMGQRLSRAKAKIRDAGIPFIIPGVDELTPRTASVLDAIYAAYGAGWDDPGGSDPKRRGLTAEAIRLARLVVELRACDAEARGLLAMMLHCEARADARRDDHDAFVPLGEQDVSQWSREVMAEAEHHLEIAVELGEIGPFQLHAAIQSVHNRRAITGATDWAAVASLYDGLVVLSPTIGAHVARAAAHGQARDAAAGLVVLDELADGAISSYQPYWATRAHLLSMIGDRAGSEVARARAIGLTTDRAVRAHLLASSAARAKSTE